MDFLQACKCCEAANTTKLQPNEVVVIWRGEATKRYEVFDRREAKGGNGISGVCFDEVKLIRAQGECLGIRSR